MVLILLVITYTLYQIDESNNQFTERSPLFPVNDVSVFPVDVHILEGKIYVESSEIKFDGATVYVKIEDTTLQDTSSILLKRIVLEDVNYDDSIPEYGILFSMPVDFEVDEKKDYLISADIDTNNNRKQDRGDYVTTVAYPVLNSFSEYYVDMTLERIN